MLDTARIGAGIVAALRSEEREDGGVDIPDDEPSRPAKAPTPPWKVSGKPLMDAWKRMQRNKKKKRKKK